MKKVLIASLAILTLSACSSIEKIPDDWKNDNINNICMYWGKAKASGNEVLAMHIENEVGRRLPTFTPEEQRICRTYAQQGYNTRKKAIAMDAAAQARYQENLKEYNRNMAIMNQNVTHSGSINIY